MTSKNRKSAIWLALLVSAVAFAAGGPPDGKGNKPTTEATNNLSVPAIVVGSLGDFKLTCPDGTFSTLTTPDPNDPVYYPADCATSKDGTTTCVEAGYYYVQGDAVWQAPCSLRTAAIAIPKWGDNLSGDASLKVGSPIRVELTLFDATGLTTGQNGYLVVKLEPDELDRASDYGHLAANNGTPDNPDFVPISKPVDGSTFKGIVHGSVATLKIQKIVGGVPGAVVYDGVAKGEINATGKIVYGYQLRVTEAGTYRITYTITNVDITGCPDGSVCGLDSVYKDIVIVSGGGRRPR